MEAARLSSTPRCRRLQEVFPAYPGSEDIPLPRNWLWVPYGHVPLTAWPAGRPAPPPRSPSALGVLRGSWFEVQQEKLRAPHPWASPPPDPEKAAAHRMEAPLRPGLPDLPLPPNVSAGPSTPVHIPLPAGQAPERGPTPQEALVGAAPKRGTGCPGCRET